MAENVALPNPPKSITTYFAYVVNKIAWSCNGRHEGRAELPYGLWPMKPFEAYNTSITNEVRYIRVPCAKEH
jgi:hypothetical protein